MPIPDWQFTLYRMFMLVFIHLSTQRTGTHSIHMNTENSGPSCFQFWLSRKSARGKICKIRAATELIHPACPVAVSGSQPPQVLAHPHTPLILNHSWLASSAWSSLVIPHTLTHLHSLQLTSQTHIHKVMGWRASS